MFTAAVTNENRSAPGDCETRISTVKYGSDVGGGVRDGAGRSRGGGGGMELNVKDRKATYLVTIRTPTGMWNGEELADLG
jgi:hypothetical protein